MDGMDGMTAEVVREMVRDINAIQASDDREWLEDFALTALLEAPYPTRLTQDN